MYVHTYVLVYLRVYICAIELTAELYGNQLVYTCINVATAILQNSIYIYVCLFIYMSLFYTIAGSLTTTRNTNNIPNAAFWHTTGESHLA